MIQGTTYVLANEPALNLAEVDLVAPRDDGKGSDWYRFQIIIVWRNDCETEYRERLGLAKDFEANQFRIMGGIKERGRVYIEHTVGELKDMANVVRERPAFDKHELAQV